MCKNEILDFVFNGLRSMVEKELEPGEIFNSADVLKIVNRIADYTIRVENPRYFIKFEDSEGNVIIKWEYANEEDAVSDFTLAETNAQEINNYKKCIYITRVYSEDNEGNINLDEKLKSFVPNNF